MGPSSEPILGSAAAQINLKDSDLDQPHGFGSAYNVGSRYAYTERPQNAGGGGGLRRELPTILIQ